ncbi:TetR/AcrR family transcriptional regulator C-terminal domain-containing protein [Streptomyces sp. NPDC057638]|uniref:TetR/AcrR family transcriptional regulator C-terminal domain-containing protein n=1 Tax=Streptomyces sp. NPDC057638 TaxID=3346190 RepID=UPI003679DB2E
MSSETSGTGDTTRSLELLWDTGERPTRGPKPALTLDRIVTTAVGIADTEGLAAVSMRRLSTALGTGTMTLYRYVPGKAELLDLMLDRVNDVESLGRTEAEIEASGRDWRDAVRSLAQGYLDLNRRHPWLLKVNQARSVLGPRALRSFDLALAAMRGLGTGLRDPELISLILSVQALAQGVARMENDSREVVEATGVTDEEFWKAQEPFLVRAMESGRYPRVAALGEDTFTEDFDHLEFGITLLVGGLEAVLAARGGAAGPGS